MAENFFGLTDTGKVRGNNEDAFIAETANAGKYIVACVIDGVGGYSGGEVAADIARESILQHVKSDPTDIIGLMKEAFNEANEKIFSERQRVKEHDSMACVLTLATVDVENNLFYYAHLGDTRLYLMRDNSLVKVTKDHSFVGFMEESGRLSEESAMKHPKRNEINKALGFGGDLYQDDYIETGQSPFLPGDLLLLCSDGLTDMVNKEIMTRVLLKDISLEDKATELIAEANAKGGKDNITVVLVHNNKEPLKHEATKPIAIKKKTEPELKKPDEPQPEPVLIKHDTVIQRKQNNALVPILSLLCLILLATTLWLLWQKGKEKNPEPVNSASAMPKPRNPSELKFQNAIDTSIGDTLTLSDSIFMEPIVISDTIHIAKDSLYIKTRGNIIIQPDSAYNGPAIKLAQQCKFISIDGLQFKGFKTGVLSTNNALFLKNVRFINCLVPYQASYSFPNNMFINGSIPNSAFKADSIAMPDVPTYSPIPNLPKAIKR